MLLKEEDNRINCGSFSLVGLSFIQLFGEAWLSFCPFSLSSSVCTVNWEASKRTNNTGEKKKTSKKLWLKSAAATKSLEPSFWGECFNVASTQMHPNFFDGFRLTPVWVGVQGRHYSVVLKLKVVDGHLHLIMLHSNSVVLWENGRFDYYLKWPRFYQITLQGDQTTF